MESNLHRIFNMSLRGITLGSRFLFVFFLAKFVEPASVGYYGIFTATVGYALYFVGLDFYTYVTREIIKTPVEQRGQLLKAQAALSGILYLALLPIMLFLLIYAKWPQHLVWWFIPILILEHVNQEIMRLLNALSEQLTASVILFMRQGSWGIAIIVLMGWLSDWRSLDHVMLMWVISGIVTAGMGIAKLKKLRFGGWNSPIDKNWLKKGILVSTAFLGATLALRGVQTIDRYWLEALGGIEIVGAYVLLLSVASTVLVFLDAGVFAYTYPALIKHHHNGEKRVAHALVMRALKQTLVITAGYGILSSLLLPYLLAWINKPIYIQMLPWYPWLLAAMAINAVSMIPHYALYAQGMDKTIIHSHLAALVGFVLFTWVVSDEFSVLAIPLGLNMAFLIILIWKSVAYSRSITTLRSHG